MGCGCEGTIARCVGEFRLIIPYRFNLRTIMGERVCSLKCRVAHIRSNEMSFRNSTRTVYETGVFLENTREMLLRMKQFGTTAFSRLFRGMGTLP